MIGFALTVYLINISTLFVSCTLLLSMHAIFNHFYIMHIFIHALVCLSLVCHLFLHHHCLLNPLSHYYCHALLNMSIYCYLIHGTKYFRRDWIFHIQFWNIQSGGTKNFVRGDKIWGDQIFHDRSLIEGTHFAYALFVWPGLCGWPCLLWGDHASAAISTDHLSPPRRDSTSNWNYY